ncbi:MAG: hypothetical protein D6679_11050 [Candidatus Hydrogenedentota bacterium]|nr:MAG: hypothetical protein D6679_11050 [Candidatus Hydrogenedentota bacterium]
MFPERLEWWREQLRRSGFVIVKERPVEYLPVLRAVEWAKGIEKRLRGKGKNDSSLPRTAERERVSPQGVPKKQPMWKNLFWEVLTPISSLLEKPAGFLPFFKASHRLFLLEKRN